MKPRVVITHWVHPEVVELLSQKCVLLSNPTRESLPREEILRRTKDAQAIMVFMPDCIDEAFLQACPSLKIVSAALKGYDNFDVEACTRHGVWFSIVTESLTVPTAELAIGLLIAVTRRMLSGDRIVRNGPFMGWRPQLYGMGLAGRTLGLIGMGAVGQAIARRAVGLGMKVLYEDIVPLPKEKEETWGLTLVPLEDLLAKSDFVMPLVPLKPDTFHLIHSGAITQMKPGSYLINICRGSVVDEEAVAQALASGRLAGYAADVFEMEDWARVDRPRSIPGALLDDTEHTFFTPHLGSAVEEIRREIALEAARHILQALNGEKPDGAINSPVTKAMRPGKNKVLKSKEAGRSADAGGAFQSVLKRTGCEMKRCGWARTELAITYHDREWGVPQHDDRALFEFLILEGAQAGLSWETILRKRENYRRVFDHFDARTVAHYDRRKVNELLANPGIIRNRLKITAAIQNARAFLAVQKEFGSFDAYVWQFVSGRPIKNLWKSLKVATHTNESDAMSRDLRRRGFKFAGTTICYAFMQAVGMVNDHEKDCFRYPEVGP